MALLIRKAIFAYLYVETELVDPRTQDWFLVSSTWKVIGIIAFYSIFVLRIGPWLMKDREPFQLKNTIIAYNAIQVALSLYLFREALTLYLGGYSLVCQPVEVEDTPTARKAASGAWVFYMVKLFEMFDTVFFVLRKKMNQVSFLHVYHHAGMILAMHIACKFIPGGHGTFLALVNSAVHVVMYFYYLLSVWNPKLINNAGWKKHITQMQIVQFMMLAVHWSLPVFIKCGYPTWAMFLMIPQNLFMFSLFSDFYYKTYIKKRPQKVE